MNTTYSYMTVVNILLDTSLILASYMKATNECEEMTSDNECIVRYTQSYNTRLEILKIKEILLYHKQFTFNYERFYNICNTIGK